MRSTVDPSAVGCSIERALHVVGERWTFLILREAHLGTTRFADFRTALGIASDVLAARLEKLVRVGVLERRDYRNQGERARADYHLTPSGVELRLVLGALGQWGDDHLPLRDGSTCGRRNRRTGEDVRVAFVADPADALAIADVTFTRPPTP
ncbi:winged helix-turn-helix transcriptional regulator [Umezawaea sp. NPDC059074]|uniref:winged helix-turn-helix transcriptional regulator n=1 Tax=Umezawaea sp. NPDC059074 TaxID=3346716 RepID=UPI003698EC31